MVDLFAVRAPGMQGESDSKSVHNEKTEKFFPKNSPLPNLAILIKFIIKSIELSLGPKIRNFACSS